MPEDIEVGDSPQKILAISGRKQAGKTTTLNFIHSLALVYLKCTPSAYVHPESGELIVQTEDGEGAVNLRDQSPDFIEYASQHIWPFIKAFSFAEVLKEICVNVFGLRPEQVYGTDEQKKTLTPFLWENMPIPAPWDNQKKGKRLEGRSLPFTLPHNGRKGQMTAREFIQYFGTEIGREIYPNVWADSTIRRIRQSMTGLAVLDDCRFPNEVDVVKNAGGKVIYLTRRVDDDDHASESSLDPKNYDPENFDKVIDNSELNIEQTNELVFQALKEWKWVVDSDGS